MDRTACRSKAGLSWRIPPVLRTPSPAFKLAVFLAHRCKLHCVDIVGLQDRFRCLRDLFMSSASSFVFVVSQLFLHHRFWILRGRKAFNSVHAGPRACRHAATHTLPKRAFFGNMACYCCLLYGWTRIHILSSRLYEIAVVATRAMKWFDYLLWINEQVFFNKNFWV